MDRGRLRIRRARHRRTRARAGKQAEASADIDDFFRPLPAQLQLVRAEDADATCTYERGIVIAQACIDRYAAEYNLTPAIGSIAVAIRRRTNSACAFLPARCAIFIPEDAIRYTTHIATARPSVQPDRALLNQANDEYA
ncbi:hypothetical protein [Burkholderia vietnamiensis]|uniref:hypothetical protein n=1 Tax=Burkholderia vietnamiensis TaxID=60552 RepID=UPI0018C8BDEB|nr:hypothetical protein [Burkholderia vietnamiensis]